MYGILHFSSNAEDATIVSQTYKPPIASYDKGLLDKIKKLRSSGYGKTLLEKNTYVVRGGLVGGVIMAGIAMIFKKNIWGLVIIGIAGGGIVGHFVGNSITKSTIKSEKDGK